MDVKKSSLEQQHEEEKEEFRDCLDGDQVVGQLQEQLNAASFVEQENKTHPSLQLASTALSKGITLDAFNNVVPPTPTSSGPSTPERRVSSSSSIDPEKAGANLIQINPVDLKTIGENTLTPAEQEKEDEAVLRGLRHLFNNRFMSAKTLFEQRADR
ncbi:hypothetical protein BDB00DRAFT_308513 [Zychaea mexicana]|uniref:uncharacterized protein n=1 Tax=Zychaea mexicana TaxID=64656 RepID=UPI0022FEADFE|nr:uncharacterized protein BDB00DRAFT_308513 [Zychaea mexicana]KAI9494555.1 hypothetical protein BDB00DRAFT_308513 [Zychaea mexicana]